MADFLKNETHKNDSFEYVKEQYLKLCRLVNIYRKRYHLNQEVGISDSFLDQMKAEVTWYEQAWPELIHPESPSQFVQSDLTE
jgi:NAD-dependent DNA ligase